MKYENMKIMIHTPSLGVEKTFFLMSKFWIFLFFFFGDRYSKSRNIINLYQFFSFHFITNMNLYISLVLKTILLYIQHHLCFLQAYFSFIFFHIKHSKCLYPIFWVLTLIDNLHIFEYRNC